MTTLPEDAAKYHDPFELDAPKRVILVNEVISFWNVYPFELLWYTHPFRPDDPTNTIFLESEDDP